MSPAEAWRLVEKWRALPEGERERHLAAEIAASKLPETERDPVWRTLRASLRNGGAS